MVDAYKGIKFRGLSIPQNIILTPDQCSLISMMLNKWIRNTLWGSDNYYLPQGMLLAWMDASPGTNRTAGELMAFWHYCTLTDATDAASKVITIDNTIGFKAGDKVTIDPATADVDKVIDTVDSTSQITLTTTVGSIIAKNLLVRINNGAEKEANMVILADDIKLDSENLGPVQVPVIYAADLVNSNALRGATSKYVASSVTRFNFQAV